VFKAQTKLTTQPGEQNTVNVLPILPCPYRPVHIPLRDMRSLCWGGPDLKELIFDCVFELSVILCDINDVTLST
jgi:hypothetical protein